MASGASALLLLLCLLPAPLTAVQFHDVPADTTTDRLREQAVQLARSGRLEEARDHLQTLRETHPTDARVLGDLLVVLGWLGADGDIRTLAEQATMDALPPYALEVVARATRNGGDAAAAAALYERVLRAEPERRDSRVGQALSLAEAGWPESALAVLRPMLEPDVVTVDAAVAAGHVHRLLNDPLESATAYAQALELEPDNADAYRGRVLALSELGAVHRATDLLAARAELFSPAERQQVEGNRAAALVRWMDLPNGPTDDPFQRIDHALDALTTRVAQVPADLTFHENRARFDRLLALAARGRAAEVVAQVEQLQAAGVELPPYALRPAGKAYLQLRRPRVAARYFRRYLALQPGNVEDRLALFYALIEAEDFRGARSQIDTLLAEQPEWRWAPGLREPRENPDRVRAEVAAHLGSAFAGRLKDAERGLARIVERAPLDPSLRSEMATVYRFRGQPARALEQAELGLALDSTNVPLRIARAWALLDLREWQRAEREVAELRTAHPENSHVQRLSTTHGLERGWALRIDGEQGNASGSVVGTDDARIEATLLSPSTDWGLRALVRTRRSEADFESGKAVYERGEAGLRLDRRRGWLSLAGGTDRNGDAPGLTAELGLRGGDRFTTSLALETRSARVPLQARVAGIDGWSGSATGRLNWHEGRTAALELSRTELDDGNVRLSALASLEQRIVTTPRLRLSTTLELYGSRNSRDDAPYFNPRIDFAPSAGLAGEWLMWRRYERSFAQHFTVAGGGYWQDGYGMEPLAVGSYQHLWSVSSGLTFRYGVTGWSRSFDGAREQRTSFTAGIDWRVQ